MKKYFFFTIIFSVSILLVVSLEEKTYGITVRGTKEHFTVFTEGSVATNITEEEDGSVSWIATAAGGAGGGVAFYVKANKEEINIANYESIDIELDYSIVEKKWDDSKINPSFVIRILPWDSTGLFGGYEKLGYIDADEKSGTLKENIKIPSDFAEKIISSSDFDSVLAFGIKFHDNKNKNGDQLKVKLKNVKFNAKEDADEDKPFDDGLEESQRGSVVEINYPTKDYTVTKSAEQYEKHGWVYLPAGYDESDKDTKYPVFKLFHRFGQNENTWGLSNKGRGGRIK